METNVGMVFVIIFTVITIAFLLAFGIGQIGSVFNMGGRAQVQKAVDDLKKNVFEIYEMAEGSSKEYRLQIPKSSKVCFVNPEKPEKKLYPGSLSWKNWNPKSIVIKSMIKNPNDPNYLSNIWIYYDADSTGEGYKIEHLYPKPEADGNGNFCAVTGVILYIENKGTYVEVSVKSYPR
jgi:hypothetical protein